MKIFLKELHENFPEFEIRNYDENAFFTVFNSDSRTIHSDELFIPIKGDKFDGHNFIVSALNNGASMALCESSQSLLVKDCLKPVILVDSIKEGLEKILNLYTSHIKVPIIAITGSVGKTTTRKMLSTILASKGKVLSADKSNINTVWGNATLLSNYVDQNYIVLECGMDHAGEIAWHMNSVDPDLGILLNVGYVHAEALGSIEAVYEEKKNMADYLNRTGKPLVLNIDDEYLARIMQDFKSELITFGVNEYADYKISNTIMNKEGISFTLTNKGEDYIVSIPVYGEALAYNATAAVAAANKLGVSIEDSVLALKKFVPEIERFEIKPIPNSDSVLVDDAYNANPESMKMSIETFAKLYPKGVYHRVVILGDMRELGKVTEQEHAKLGESVRSLGFEEVFYIGEYFKYFQLGKEIMDTKDIASLIQGIISKYPKSAILLKASHSVGLSEIAKSLSI